MQINQEDMLESTRRMTWKRNCFFRDEFTERSSDRNHVILFQENNEKMGESIKNVLGCQ